MLQLLLTPIDLGSGSGDVASLSSSKFHLTILFERPARVLASGRTFQFI